MHIGSCNTTENVAYSLVFLLEGGGTSSAKCKILHWSYQRYVPYIDDATEKTDVSVDATEKTVQKLINFVSRILEQIIYC